MSERKLEKKNVPDSEKDQPETGSIASTGMKASMAVATISSPSKNTNFK